jgi:hypothetical protein
MCVFISPIINYLEVLLIYFETLDLEGKESDDIKSEKRPGRGRYLGPRYCADWGDIVPACWVGGMV